LKRLGPVTYASSGMLNSTDLRERHGGEIATNSDHEEIRQCCVVELYRSYYIIDARRGYALDR